MKHKGKKDHCDTCEYQATTKRSLTQHKQLIHEDIHTCGCDSCAYQASRRGSLSQHRQSKHEEKKYPYDSCNYQASERRTPYEAHHRNEKFICKECDFQASYIILNKATAIATSGFEISLWLM